MTTIASVATSAATYRDLVFSPVELTDDDAFLDTTNVKDLGDISLKVFEVLQYRKIKMSIPKAVKVLDEKVHERSKKVTGHRVCLGPEKSMIPYPGMFVADKIGSVPATFVFKYRPIDVLKADGIVPVNLSNPINQGGKRKAQHIDGNAVGGESAGGTERLQNLKEEVDHVQARLPATITSEWPNKRVKTEIQQTSLPREVVDLT